MKIIDLKQNLENLYKSENMDFCTMDNGHLWIHFHYPISYFLIGCDENQFLTNSLTNSLRYDMRVLKKVLKECYNIVPYKEGRYS